MSVAAQKRRKILIAAGSATVAVGAFGFAVNSLRTQGAAPAAAVQAPGGGVPTMPAVGGGGVVGPSATPDPNANANGISLKAGDKAISIPFDPTKGAGGYVAPGDSLDLLVSDGHGGVTYGLQDIKVLKVGANTALGAGSGSGATTVPAGGASTGTAGANTILVVEVTAQQAAELAFLTSATGSAGAPASGQILQYVLRAPNDTSSGTAVDVNASNWAALSAVSK